MSVASGGSVDKAWFFNEENGAYFEVQYNPLSFNLERSATWKEEPIPGNAPGLQYQGTALATISMELMFDTTHDGSDVRKSWVDSLLKLLNPEFEPVDGQQSDQDKTRPPRVWFQWGSNNMLCVVESVSTAFMMFGQDGTPLRAKVAVKLKEYPPEKAEDEGSAQARRAEYNARWTDGSGGSFYQSSALKMVTVGPGETISAIALRMGTTPQAICDASGIDDPLSVAPGTTVAVPGRS
jgi:hypothetical protein